MYGCVSVKAYIVQKGRMMFKINLSIVAFFSDLKIVLFN